MMQIGLELLHDQQFFLLISPDFMSRLVCF